MSTLSAQARSLYRRLLRTQKRLFIGDVKSQQEAWRYTRQSYREAQDLKDPALIQEKINHGHAVCDMLLKNVVQLVKATPVAQLPNATNDAVADDASDVYRLRLTSDTEINDNDDQKNGKGVVPRDPGFRCSDKGQVISVKRLQKQGAHKKAS